MTLGWPGCSVAVRGCCGCWRWCVTAVCRTQGPARACYATWSGANGSAPASTRPGYAMWMSRSSIPRTSAGTVTGRPPTCWAGSNPGCPGRRPTRPRCTPGVRGPVGGGPVPSLRSIGEAVGSWPETATAVAVRVDGDDRIEICAPHGLTDLLGGVWRHNPRQISAALSRGPAAPAPAGRAVARGPGHRAGWLRPAWCRAARRLPGPAGSSGSRTPGAGIRPCACRTALMTAGLGSANSAADSAARR
jgi:nucleotidyltransferase-like protein